MARWRVVLDMEHPDASSDEISEWVEQALSELRDMPGMYVDIDELEQMGTE